MHEEVVIDSRPDREIRKKIISPGDYNLVPYEDARCKIIITDVTCTSETGPCEIEAQSRIFSPQFDGNVLIGDSDFFIDKDIEIVLQRMCSGEVCSANIVYRDNEGNLVKKISCKIEIREVVEEQLISEWSWNRLHESAVYHKEKGVELIREKRVADAFRRFSKALKMVVAMEPVDPEVIDEEKIKEIIDLRVKLYNNLAHCQLQYNEYEAALDLSNRALKYQPENAKALYRRCLSYTSMSLYEEAWKDIQEVLRLEPNNKTAQQKAVELQPKIKKINAEYKNVIKKMFG